MRVSPYRERCTKQRGLCWYSFTKQNKVLTKKGSNQSQKRCSEKSQIVFAKACNNDATATVLKPNNDLLVAIVEKLFKFPPIFNMAAASARKKIICRASQLFKSKSFMPEDLLYAIDWSAAVQAAIDPSVHIPEYYKAPFHAYPSGNLDIVPALEVDLAAMSVHASVMDPTGKTLDPEGDNKLRGSYSRCQKELLRKLGARKIEKILDVGAATGLSSLELMRAHPDAEVVGIDLSPYFLAVGKYQQQQREKMNMSVVEGEGEEGSSNKEKLTLLHAQAEDTKLPSESLDLVSICLVCHELPQQPTKDIFKEAYRLLKQGGALSIMEMNPNSPAFQRVLSNPIPYVVFKSTEPYLSDYVELNMSGSIVEAGFEEPTQLENSPRHKTVVALKK
jgi:ubiquinone/menaquinone biosynthesis C-methylase UbiE